MSDEHCNEKHCKEIITKLYESLSMEIREIERNYISLIVPFVGALGIFGIGLKVYLDLPNPQNHFFFLITTFGSIFICIIIWFSANIFGYTHRSNQIILSRIEKECCFYNNKKKILPEKWNLLEKLSKCENIDNPEIYKLFKLSVLVFSILCILIFLLCSFWLSWRQLDNEMNILMNIFFLISIPAIIFAVFIYKFGWKFQNNSYHEKLKQLARNLSSSGGDFPNENR